MSDLSVSFRDSLRLDLLASHRLSAKDGPVRIGVVADTHCEDGSQLPDAVLEAFAGVDVILHAGDLGVVGVLDRLAEVAPVLAVRSVIDPTEPGGRLADRYRTIAVGPVVIGIVTELVDQGEFGRPVDVIIHGTSHRASVEEAGGVLLVNPGSPTLPADGRPAVAIIEIDGPDATARIVTFPPRPRL